MTDTTLFFALLRCLITGAPTDPATLDRLTADTAPSLLALARHHDAAHWVGYALGLENSHLLTTETGRPFATAQIQAMLRYEQLRYEQQRAMATLETARIPFVPLKGAILRNYYPQPWLRTSCDIDLLVPSSRMEEAVSALSAAGWTPKEYSDYHDRSLYSAGGVHLELHFSLRENRPAMDTVLDTVWEHCAPTEEGRYEYEMSGAFFLFHQVAHAAYHFTAGGCGVRPFMDVRLLCDRLTYDPAAFEQLCTTAGLMPFWTQMQALCRVWFDGEPHSDLTSRMEAFILSGGVYGTQSNRETMERAQSGGKRRHLWRRVWMPYDQLCLTFPALKGRPYLTPLYQMRRWGRLLWGGRLSASLNEWQATVTSDANELNATMALLRDLQL